jgi:PAS domain S-box-containing protein
MPEETSLVLGRQALEGALARIGDGLIVTDTSGRVTFLNTIAEQLTGWSREGAVSESVETVFRIVDARTGRQVEHPVSKVLRSGGIVGLANHTVLIHRCGGRIPIDGSGAPNRSTTGELLGVAVIFRDVTERQRAEEARGRLAAILESSDDAIVDNTLTGIVTSWNPGAKRLFGYEPEEIVGKSITIIIPPGPRGDGDEILPRWRRGERVVHLETVGVAKDGRRIDISVTVSPIRNEEGEIVGASKIARDITERKRTERVLHESDLRMHEFLAALAHEIRNPLAPIRMGTELLRLSEHLAPELRAVSLMLERQVRELTHLVDDLLDVSRITSGQLHLKREPIDLSTLLTTVIESYRSLFEGARQEVTFSATTDPLHVNGDRVRLTRVFSNILYNAAKYAPAAGRIRIELRMEGDFAVVSVRDGGIDIPREAHDQVFELFLQLGRTYERTDDGLGIGLTVVRRIVEMHDGSIEARSEVLQKGREFVIRLPALKLPDAPTAHHRRERSEHGLSRRVLLADDNHDAAVSLGMLLQEMGHETRIAYDGQEAVEAAEVYRPDVVLLDLAMPKLDGYEAARRIASRPWAGSTLIVAVTSWGQEVDRERTREAGFHEHLVKPVEPATLRQLLGETRPLH